VIPYDQRFKELLTGFPVGFLALCFPAMAARLDCAAPEFLDKETFSWHGAWGTGHRVS